LCSTVAVSRQGPPRTRAAASYFAASVDSNTNGGYRSPQSRPNAAGAALSLATLLAFTYWCNVATYFRDARFERFLLAAKIVAAVHELQRDTGKRGKQPGGANRAGGHVAANALQLARRQGTLPIGAEKQPVSWAGALPIDTEKFENMIKQDRVAVFTPVALPDVNDHPVSIDVIDRETYTIRIPTARTMAKDQTDRPGNR
jgi:hypothetical protein